MSTTSIPHRRRAELAAKVESLDQELDYWRAQTAQGYWARHHSQLHRLSAQLTGLLDPVRREMADARTSEADLLRLGDRWEKAILAAHTIWEFFRSKFLLRESALFRDHLAICDDLAWECYRPARDRLTGPSHRKEPPLVYFSATWSPFAVSRDTTFANELRGAQGTAGFLMQDRFQDVLRQLPIPLVSLPWYQVAHLPSALIIAHEIGHVVEWDFNLSADLEAAVARSIASPDHLLSWQGWRQEVFADLFGCCAVGGAFAGALLDLLATDPETVRQDDRLSGRYPPRALRAAIVIAALQELGHPADATTLHADWSRTFGPPPEGLRSCLSEVTPTVRSLLAGPYGGHPLRDLVPSLTDDVASLARDAASDALLPVQLSARAAVAAARWLQVHDEAPEVVAQACTRLRRAVGTAPTTTRRIPSRRAPGGPIAAVIPLPTTPMTPETGLPEADQAAGRRLLGDLFPEEWDAGPARP